MKTSPVLFKRMRVRPARPLYRRVCDDVHSCCLHQYLLLRCRDDWAEGLPAQLTANRLCYNDSATERDGEAAQLPPQGTHHAVLDERMLAGDTTSLWSS